MEFLLASLADETLRALIEEEVQDLRYGYEEEAEEVLLEHAQELQMHWEKASSQLSESEAYQRVLKARREAAAAENAYDELKQKHLHELKEKTRVRRRAAVGELQEVWQEYAVRQEEMAQKQQAMVQSNGAALYPTSITRQNSNAEVNMICISENFTTRSENDCDSRSVCEKPDC